MLSGFGYLTGIFFVFVSLLKFRKIASGSPQSPSQEKILIPLTYMGIGAGLIFMSSLVSVLANTLFGSANVLAYTSNNDATVMSVMTFLIQTAGVLWFVRGSVLLVHASEPGVKEGSKGLTFIFAGVFAINFETTFEMLNALFTYLFSVMNTLKNNIMDW